MPKVVLPEGAYGASSAHSRMEGLQYCDALWRPPVVTVNEYFPTKDRCRNGQRFRRSIELDSGYFETRLEPPCLTRSNLTVGRRSTACWRS